MRTYEAGQAEQKLNLFAELAPHPYPQVQFLERGEAKVCCRGYHFDDY